MLTTNSQDIWAVIFFSFDNKITPIPYLIIHINEKLFWWYLALKASIYLHASILPAYPKSAIMSKTMLQTTQVPHLVTVTEKSEL
jgi:hypothetical protein